MKTLFNSLANDNQFTQKRVSSYLFIWNRILKPIYIVIIAGLVFLSSCSKDKVGIVNSDRQVLDMTATKKIVTFKERMQLKAEGTLETDSAVWYIEGLLNFENASNDHVFETTDFFKDSIIIEEQNGEINMEDIQATYMAFMEFLNETAAQQNNPEFAYDMVDISLQYGDSVKLILTSEGGEKGGELPHYNPFDVYDNWHWGWNLGKCDNTMTGQDAADQLEFRFNHPNWVPQEGYYTDLQTIWDIRGANYPPDTLNPGPYTDYIIFYYTAPTITDEPCLLYDELNFYLNKFDFIQNAERPEYKTFISVDVRDETIPGMGDPNRLHVYDLTYGIFHLSPHEE